MARHARYAGEPESLNVTQSKWDRGRLRSSLRRSQIGLLCKSWRDAYG